MINDRLKNVINELQSRIVDCTESDNILLIFDNEQQLKRYKNRHKYLAPNILCTTLDNLDTFIRGRRFKRYIFMTDDMI